MIRRMPLSLHPPVAAHHRGATATGLQNTTTSPVRIFPAPATTSAERPLLLSPGPAGHATSATRTATIPACQGRPGAASPAQAGVTSGSVTG